jgi:hypothetical protein
MPLLVGAPEIQDTIEGKKELQLLHVSLCIFLPSEIFTLYI